MGFFLQARAEVKWAKHKRRNETDFKRNCIPALTEVIQAQARRAPCTCEDKVELSYLKLSKMQTGDSHTENEGCYERFSSGSKQVCKPLKSKTDSGIDWNWSGHFFEPAPAEVRHQSRVDASCWNYY